MTKYVKGQTPEEEIASWLARMNIPVEETTEIERFRTALGAKLQEGKGYLPSEMQVETLWSAVPRQFQWGQAGMRVVYSRTRIGAPMRVAVRRFPGDPRYGMFGLRMARQIFSFRLGLPPPF